MSTSEKGVRYVLISPVKDEERYVETTLRAVLNQTIRPYRWILVDDGSRDKTHEIVEAYASEVDWITLITLRRDASRQPGSGIINAFNEGFRAVNDEEFDFIVKLDCDIDFPPDYFERVIAEFNRDPRLGIASGMFYELRHGKWTLITMPPYHAAGQTKMVRMECFRDIGGFVPSRGWDSYDEIKAQVAGWKTCHFTDIRFYHLKLEGSGIGFLRTSMMLGQIHYLTGGGFFFFVLKCMYYIFAGKPFLLGAVMMFTGYLKTLLAREKRLVNPIEAKFYRDLLNRRIIDAVAGIPHWKRLRRKEFAA